MIIRKAEPKDIRRIGILLGQVNALHHAGRPDIFKLSRKYSDNDLMRLISDKQHVVFVALDDTGTVIGHAICVRKNVGESPLLNPIQTLYLDDLCVDAAAQGQGAGSALCHAVAEEARAIGCHNVVLNVWACNAGAMRFYRNRGFATQKVAMEIIVDAEAGSDEPHK